MGNDPVATGHVITGGVTLGGAYGIGKLLPSGQSSFSYGDGIYLYHAVTNPQAASGILNGVDPKFLNPESRFGAAFYVAEKPDTTLAELAHHGASPTHGIRFEFNSMHANILDLTDVKIAKTWGYNGGPISYRTQQIGIEAREQGYNSIRFNSQRHSEGVNHAVLDDFDKLLIPKFVSPIQP